MMKKFIAIFVLAIISISLSAQEGNLGIFAGVGYYNGELNQRNVFYSPTPSLGIIYRHNFNKRWAFRISANYCTLKGSDAHSQNSYDKARNYSFSNTVWDLGPQIELNFLDYDKDAFTYHYFTPYLASGILLSIIPDAKRSFEIAVPIGFGIKYAVATNITAGLEWSYRWTNSDEVDALERDVYTYGNKQRSYNPNSDWYSFFRAHITIRVFKEDMPCPAF